MKIYRFADVTSKARAIALGYFDGGHVGHAALLRETVRIASQQGYESSVFTFPSLPTKKGAPLSTLPDRLAFFEAMGVESVILSPFDEVRDLSADAFAEDVLKAKLSAKAVVCGFNYRFGKGALGNNETLARHFSECHVFPPHIYGDSPVSASRIRASLTEGDISSVREMLGRPYTVTGKVSHGKAVGHLLGFPTANILPQTMLPRYGVYKTEVTVDGKTYRGLSDVGIRPTLEAEGMPRVETFLANFSGDLYEKQLSVSFLSFVREEMKFDSPDALIAQIEKDLENL